MSDLISRQAAIAALHDEIMRRRLSEDSNNDGALDEFDTEAILRRLPSAKPAPIKHGLWIVETDCEGKTRRCIYNQCGFETGKYTWENPAHCEGCGAIMDGEEDDNG